MKKHNVAEFWSLTHTNLLCYTMSGVTCAGVAQFVMLTEINTSTSIFIYQLKIFMNGVISSVYLND